MQFSYQTNPQYEQDVELLEDVVIEKVLVLYNDDVNTFEWVIESLIDVCKHSAEQAEQCAYFIHHKGKYAVKHGDFEKLKTMKDGITDRGINATIE